mmetsp:Transcript_24903/g.46468  ORF Transcript_24903/g.46468 Transcript_24903/m.46468 type:complete len:228 (+) Transcript_24903:95-778(+)
MISSMLPALSKRVLSISKTQVYKCLQMNAHRSISTSRLLLANVTVEVPALGESISEGSVASFEKAIGEVVDVDDVIAVIETDKVTVEIKSPYKGTLVELLCAESDEITVGSPLYTIDTNDSVVVPEKTTNTEAPVASSSSSASTSAPTSGSHKKRVPLIKFLGKRSLLKKDPAQSSSATSTSTATADHQLSPVASMYDNYNAATLGRPGLTEAEIEAVETGGASLFA